MTTKEVLAIVTTICERRVASPTVVSQDVVSYSLTEDIQRLAKSHETLRVKLESAMVHVDTAHDALTKIKRRILA